MIYGGKAEVISVIDLSCGGLLGTQTLSWAPLNLLAVGLKVTFLIQSDHHVHTQVAAALFDEAFLFFNFISFSFLFFHLNLISILFKTASVRGDWRSLSNCLAVFIAPAGS